MAPLPEGTTHGQYLAVCSALFFWHRGHGYEVILTGESFNDVYLYVDGLLIVLCCSLSCCASRTLPADQLAFKCFTLGRDAAAMVALGYPGEIQDEQ